MPSNRPRPAICALVLTFLAALPALAGPKPVRLPAGPPFQGYDAVIPVGPEVSGPGFCEQGGAAQPFDDIDIFLIPDDRYYTLLDPATCAECVSTGTMTVHKVHIALNFRTACTQPVWISILESTAGSCPEPDLNKVLMAPAQFPLQAGGPGIFLFEVDLPTPVCLRGKAFLGVTVNEYGAECAIEELNTPTLVYADTMQCEPCRAYNYYPDEGGMFRDQFCDEGRRTPGLPVHYVSGSCCELMPALPSTWGRVKTRYQRRGRRTRSGGPARDPASPRRLARRRAP